MRLRQIAVGVMVVAALALAGGAAGAGKAGGQFVLVLADGLCWRDVAHVRAPNLRRMMQEGAVGLMQCRATGKQVSAAGYLSLGAGARAVAEMSGEQAGWCGAEGDAAVEEVAGEFVSRAGFVMERGQVGCWGIQAMVRENAAQPTPARPGALGEALRAAGKVAACAGNADVRGQLRRLVATVAMESHGMVPTGFVGGELGRRQAQSAAGVGTDFEALWAATSALLARADFVAVELGDTGRLLTVAEWIESETYRYQRHLAIERADDFLGKVMSAVARRGGAVMFAVPSGLPGEAGAREPLTPVVLWGKGVRPGLLTSPTTRTPGLIANMDVAPTALAFLGVAVPPEMTGRPARGRARDAADKVSEVEKFAAAQAAIEGIRVPVMHGLAGLMAAAAGLALGLMLLGERRPRWLAWVARLMLVLALAAVLSLLLAASARMESAREYLMFAGLCTALWTMVALLPYRSSRPVHWPAFLWGFAAALCLLDVLTGGPWVRYSVLTYSAGQGARFYGIGNEAAGVVIAGAVASAVRLVDLRDSRLTRGMAAFGLLATCGILAWPSLGADFGNGLAAAVGFSVAAWSLWPVQSRRRAFLIVGTLAVAAVALGVGFDLLQGGAGQSHVGRAFAGGAGNVAAVAGRKLAKAWVLLEHSPWTWTLCLAGLALFLAHLLRPGGVGGAAGKESRLGAVVAGCVAGGAAALVFNDSGVVTAALCVFFAAACLFLEDLTPAKTC